MRKSALRAFDDDVHRHTFPVIWIDKAGSDDGIAANDPDFFRSLPHNSHNPPASPQKPTDIDNSRKDDYS